MFEIKFPVSSSSSIEHLKSILPAKWTLQESDSDKILEIVERLTNECVGNLLLFDENVVIKTREGIRLVESFWKDFGLKYPELNPFDIRFGILYQIDGTETFELDEFPKHSPDDVLEDIKHYKNVDAYYVSFRYGDWHPGSHILTLICRKILKNGTLGIEKKHASFSLGNIENENTM